MVAILGHTGAGKTTIAKEYAERQGERYLSTGDIARKSALDNKQVADDLSRGNLSSDEIGMRHQLAEIIDSENDCVIEGFPRYLEQMYWLSRV